jgi:1-acyl-sn-glycerol-3-phosphate acyltransferase
VAALRFAAKAGALCVLIAVVVPLQAVALATTRRGATGPLPRAFHRACARILGLEVEVLGEPCVRSAIVYASNHLSYLDVFALGGLLPARFVAKEEMRGWPVLGWLATLQRTLFVSRTGNRAAGVVSTIAAALATGDALILFAEGTTSDGVAVLPFKSSAFAPFAAASVRVQPVTLSLLSVDGQAVESGDGPLRDAYAYYGDMHMAPHLLGFLRLGGARVRLRFHPPVDAADCADRKALSHEVRRRVVQGLAEAGT